MRTMPFVCKTAAKIYLHRSNSLSGRTESGCFEAGGESFFCCVWYFRTVATILFFVSERISYTKLTLQS